MASFVSQQYSHGTASSRSTPLLTTEPSALTAASAASTAPDTDNGCTTSCHDELAECQDSGFFEREDGTSVEERFEQLEDTGLLRSVLDTTWTVDEDDGGDLDDSDVIETAEENEARLFQEFIASIGNSGQSNTGKKDRPQSLRSAVSTPVRKNWHGKTANQPLGKESTEDDGGPLT